MIKRIVIYALIIMFIIGAVIAVKAVNFGALTIKLIERTAKVEITYQGLKGSILSGFRIENYCVRLSPDDSISGATADINYRLRPLGFRLPSLFEITLIEPTLTLKYRTAESRTGRLRLPAFNVGLRIIAKNGELAFHAENPYTFTGISGLIFVDLVGDHVYINTVNLAFRSVEYPVKINSANVDLRISAERIEIRSLRIKGAGLSITGSADYRQNENTGRVKINSASLNLDQFGDLSGDIEIKGDIEYKNGKIHPRVQGRAFGVDPLQSVAFETNMSADTIMVNLFDGVLLQGEAFAQIMYLNPDNWSIEANFKRLNVNQYLSLQQPLLVNGYAVYRNKKFVAFINSPADSGINVDSLYLYGTLNRRSVNVDSGFILDEKRSLWLSGILGPDFSLDLKFHEFDLTRLIRLVSLSGSLDGTCRISGNTANLGKIRINSDLQIEDLVFRDAKADRFDIVSSEFSPDELGALNISAVKLRYGTIISDTLALTVMDNSFAVSILNQDGLLRLNGRIDQDKTGIIDTLIFRYHQIETSNDGPIVFDLKKPEIGDFRLFFINGILEANISERRFLLRSGDLNSLATLIGLEEPVSGTIDLSISRDSFLIDAGNVSLRQFFEGSVHGYGRLTNGRVDLSHLKAIDMTQELEADGYWTKDHVEINARLKDVGIWTLFFLEKTLKDPSGLMSGSVSFNGNLDKFKFSGAGTISRGAFTIEAIDARIDSAEGNVRFQHNRIHFDNIQGRLTTRNRTPLAASSGQVSGAGIISLEPKLKVRNLNFDFNFIDAPLQFQPYAFGVGSGNFTVSLINNIAHYNGNITVKQGTVPVDFGMRVKIERPVNEEKWRMNIRIKGERNIWLRNRETDIEFGGELHVMKEQGAPYLSGTMKTHRGNFYWLNHILTITEGQLTFVPEEKIDPELDVWAEMDTREGIKIILHCFGPISEPVFEFFSDPPDYSEQDIITYLNLNLSWRELESLKQGQYVGSVLPNAIVSWLESDVSRRIRRYTGLDYFRIETPLFEPESKTKVTVGKYISKNIFITYTYDITSFSNMFNVEYFIDDKNEIIIRRNDEGEYSLLYQYRIRF